MGYKHCGEELVNAGPGPSPSLGKKAFATPSSVSHPGI